MGSSRPIGLSQSRISNILGSVAPKEFGSQFHGSMECALDAAFWFGFEAAVAAKPGSTVISPTLKGLLEFGHFEEQFPWVDPHPVRRPADHPLPKGEGEMHASER